MSSRGPKGSARLDYKFYRECLAVSGGPPDLRGVCVTHALTAMSRCRAERTDISEATVSSRPLCSNSPMRSATSHEHSTVCFHWGNIPYARSSDRISFVGMSALYISFSRTFLVLPRRHLINFSPALRLSNEILVQVIAIRSNGRHMVSCLNSNFICIFMRSNVLKIIVSLSFYCVPGSERNCSNSIKSLEERGLIKIK